MPSNSPVSVNTLRQSLEQLDLGLALFDVDSKLQFCNRLFRQRFARLGPFLEPATDWELFYTEADRHYGTTAFAELNQHLDSLVSAKREVEFSRGEQHSLLRLQLMEDGGFAVTETDVTPLHNAEQSGDSASRLLGDVLDGTASRIAMVDPDNGQILYNTPAWSGTFQPVERVNDLFKDPLAFTDILTDVLSSGFEDDLEVVMLKRNALAFPARVAARLIDYLGADALILSVEDLTRQRRQQRQILQTQQRLFDAIEALDQGFVLFDADAKVVVCNEPYKQLASLTGVDVAAGVSNRALIDAALSHQYKPEFFGLPDGAQTDAQFDLEFLDGRIFEGSRRATSDGGFILAWRDVSQQVANERELEKRREAAYQTEKLSAMGQLLAGVAHELNNPLSVVLGHAMMLQEDLVDTEASHSVERISRAAERCAKIVRTFLAMARQSPPQMAETSVSEVIELAIEITAPGLRKQGVSFEVACDEGLLVMGDESQLTQVLINLFLNAGQAKTEACSTLSIKVSGTKPRNSDDVIIRVSDDGPGIPDPVANRVFEPFYTTKDVGEGTGLGLSLCHRMIETHGGTLGLADSEIGGATFEICLPSVEAADTDRV